MSPGPLNVRRFSPLSSHPAVFAVFVPGAIAFAGAASASAKAAGRMLVGIRFTHRRLVDHRSVVKRRAASRLRERASGTYSHERMKDVSMPA
ncbi:hypothetical protein AQ802_18865 [Burkholderia pseudomallei]|uniref:Uncharacterized protein n=1 Tax=Burkholderia pseudomallei 1710a TaxID=320371 RepID=A0A0E1VTF8_BURPE|nr:hypothetical protein [Burkholderia pseudomallei]EET04220.1 hypothetical protein BURPS1710A_A3306 [Burkholderia pseudomallei 1710a]OMQ62807.1 hypothetical protein AQ709_15605 [Burkholderia pseudomallei]OMQ70718.1 hypothetical protein AQ711_28470 [Burkholderia pseudomallei]OMQ73302.1 hypothetical protein AQ712_28310 [Burkholderia pseudomallei]OMR57166.1 hypothetical protein AQ726_03915 [Burkholderia pseudomallei]